MHQLCILYKVLTGADCTDNLLSSTSPQKQMKAGFIFFPLTNPDSFVKILKGMGGAGGGDWKGKSLYSVVELLKQRAGRNCCSSVCAACVYERVFYFFLITRMDNDHLWG